MAIVAAPVAVDKGVDLLSNRNVQLALVGLGGLGVYIFWDEISLLWRVGEDIADLEHKALKVAEDAAKTAAEALDKGIGGGLDAVDALASGDTLAAINFVHSQRESENIVTKATTGMTDLVLNVIAPGAVDAQEKLYQLSQDHPSRMQVFMSVPEAMKRLAQYEQGWYEIAYAEPFALATSGNEHSPSFGKAVLDNYYNFNSEFEQSGIRVKIWNVTTPSRGTYTYEVEIKNKDTGAWEIQTNEFGKFGYLEAIRVWAKEEGDDSFGEPGRTVTDNGPGRWGGGPVDRAKAVKIVRMNNSRDIPYSFWFVMGGGEQGEGVRFLTDWGIRLSSREPEPGSRFRANYEATGVGLAKLELPGYDIITR